MCLLKNVVVSRATEWSMADVTLRFFPHQKHLTNFIVTVLSAAQSDKILADNDSETDYSRVKDQTEQEVGATDTSPSPEESGKRRNQHQFHELQNLSFQRSLMWRSRDIRKKLNIQKGIQR